MATRSLTTSRPGQLAVGVMLGALGGALAIVLGFHDVTGLHSWTVVAIAGALGIALSFTRWLRLIWVADAIMIAIVLIVALTPAIQGPARALVRRDPMPAQPADAVVVLSSWMNDAGYLSFGGVERLLTGLALVRHGAAPRLVVSRLHLGVNGRDVTSDANQRQMLALIAPGAPMLTVDSVHGTHDEAVKVAAMARQQGWQRIVLVTSPLHTSRACRTFERAGLRVTCAPSEPYEVAVDALNSGADRLLAFRLVSYEWVAGVVYRIRGWV